MKVTYTTLTNYGSNKFSQKNLTTKYTHKVKFNRRFQSELQLYCIRCLACRAENIAEKFCNVGEQIYINYYGMLNLNLQYNIKMGRRVQK